MASVIDSVEENPFDHLIQIKLDSSGSYIVEEFRCIAIDQFTNQIYVIRVDLYYVEMWDLLIYSHSGKFLRSFSNFSYMKIYGMAIHKNNVYIVSGLSLLHFKVADSISLIRRKNYKGTGIGEFMEPRQLDISKEGDLFVADFGNNRVQILDGNLQYKRHISHHSMLKPCDVKLIPDEVYVLGDSPEESTYSIHIFTYMGEKLRSIILNGIPKSMLWSGFSVDTRGNAAIIDIETSQIKFFTKEGDLIETMVPLKEDISKFRGTKIIIGVTWITNQKLIVLSKEHGCGGLEIYSYV